jgi:hypothetical protein
VPSDDDNDDCQSYGTEFSPSAALQLWVFDQIPLMDVSKKLQYKTWISGEKRDLLKQI